MVVEGERSFTALRAPSGLVAQCGLTASIALAPRGLAPSGLSCALRGRTLRGLSPPPLKARAKALPKPSMPPILSMVMKPALVEGRRRLEDEKPPGPDTTPMREVLGGSATPPWSSAREGLRVAGVDLERKEGSSNASESARAKPATDGRGTAGCAGPKSEWSGDNGGGGGGCCGGGGRGHPTAEPDRAAGVEAPRPERPSFEGGRFGDSGENCARP